MSRLSGRFFMMKHPINVRNPFKFQLFNLLIPVQLTSTKNPDLISFYLLTSVLLIKDTSSSPTLDLCIKTCRRLKTSTTYFKTALTIGCYYNVSALFALSLQTALFLCEMWNISPTYSTTNEQGASNSGCILSHMKIFNTSIVFSKKTNRMQSLKWSI